MAEQQSLAFRYWGGRRKGAGRKRSSTRQNVQHTARQRFGASRPLHVTMRAVIAAGNLRQKARFVRIREALTEAKDHLGMRIVHFSVLKDHIHLIVEAAAQPVLSRAMQGLGI